MSSFLRRTLTGIWIVLFVLGGFWLHPVSFFITGLIILTGSQYEYYQLIRGGGSNPQTVTGIIAGSVMFIISTLVSAGRIGTEWFLALIPLLLLIMATELYRRNEKPFDSLAHTFFPLFYYAVPFCLFPFASFSRTGLAPLLPAGTIDFSPGIVIGFFILLWTFDTAAYLTGITFGRHRLLERISPKKSWEGFSGGIIITALVAWLLAGWLGVTGTAGWIIISVIISVAGTYGDLVESMLKRSLGVKDSGSIMPGHGGFLDRFDSTVFSFPLVYLFILLFG